MVVTIARLQWLLLLFISVCAFKSPIDRVLQTNTSALCVTSLSPDITTDKTAAYGIVFAVASATTDTIGTSVLSIGFHVDTSLAQSSDLQYEVYTLNEEGYYADPNRGDSPISTLSFDYRGQLDAWSLVASGGIVEMDLEVVETSAVSQFLPF
jgi:hypothetical protein